MFVHRNLYSLFVRNIDVRLPTSTDGRPLLRVSACGSDIELEPEAEACFHNLNCLRTRPEFLEHFPEFSQYVRVVNSTLRLGNEDLNGQQRAVTESPSDTSSLSMNIGTAPSLAERMVMDEAFLNVPFCNSTDMYFTMPNLNESSNPQSNPALAAVSVAVSQNNFSSSSCNGVPNFGAADSTCNLLSGTSPMQQTQTTPGQGNSSGASTNLNGVTFGDGLPSLKPPNASFAPPMPSTDRYILDPSLTGNTLDKWCINEDYFKLAIQVPAL